MHLEAILLHKDQKMVVVDLRNHVMWIRVGHGKEFSL
jgi:hypothetical protein